MIAAQKQDRKARFRAALALAHLTAAQWAEQQGVTGMHLSLVLAGKRESLSLSSKVDAFADEVLKSVAAA